VTARELSGPEHAQVWKAAAILSSAYTDYAESLPRPIPVMLLVED